MACSILVVSEAKDFFDSSLHIEHASTLPDVSASSAASSFDAVAVCESAPERPLDPLVEDLRRAYPRTPLIFLMKRCAAETMLRAQRAGFDGILPQEGLDEEKLAALLLWIKERAGDRGMLHVVAQDAAGCDATSRELLRRVEQEKITAEIIADFAFQRNRDDFSRAVDHALALLGEHNGVERAYLFLFRGDAMDNTHEWCASGIAPQKHLLQALPLDMFPWWMDNLRMNGAFYVPEVSGMPPEARTERKILEEQGIRSLVVFGVEVSGELKGFVGFDNVPAGVISPERDFPLLSSIAKVIGRALALLQADEALKVSEHRYQSIVEKQSDLICRFTPDGAITFCNPAYARYFGEEPESLIGTNIRLFLPGDTGYLDEYLAGLKPDAPQSSMEDKIVMPDGSVRWQLWNDTGFFDEEGRLTEIQAVGWDMTELKNAMLEAETQRRRLRTLFEASPEGIVVCGDGARIDEANKAFCDMVALRPEEALGRRVEDLLETPDREEAARKDAFFRRVREGEGFAEEEGVKIDRNGRFLFLSLAALPVPNGEGGEHGRYFLFRDLTPLKMREEELRRNLETLRKTFRQTIDVLSSATEIRDPYTAGHQRRVARLSADIARRMGMSADALEGLALAASVHDIGKMSIPSEILSKPCSLSELEFSFIRTHPQEGFDMLRKVDFPWRLAEIVHQHHERMDGSGYPQGLSGDDILPEARILAVADVVEAVASHRPYRPSKGVDEALRIVREGRGRAFDPSAADACIALFEDGYSLEE